MTKNGSIEQIKELISTRTLEEQIAFFRLFDSAEDFFNWHGQVSSESKAELAPLYTAEYREICRKAWAEVFGDQKDTMIKMAAKYYNEASENDIKIAFGAQNKESQLSWYRCFENKQKYLEWQASILPEKLALMRSLKSEEFIAMQKEAQMEVWGEIAL